MKVIPGQLLPNTFQSDGQSTYTKNGQIYCNYFGELTTVDGFYKINVLGQNLHLVKKRRKDAIFINNEWVKATEFRLGDVVFYDGKELIKMANKTTIA